MKHIICTLCKNLQKPELLYKENFSQKDLSGSTFSARRLPDRIHYALYRCARCGLIFSNPILPSSEIAALYRKSTVTYSSEIPYTTKTYLTLVETVPHIPKHPKILEIGSGSGFFLEALMKHNVAREVWGVEPSKDAVQKSPPAIAKHTIQDIFKPGQFTHNSFDIICSFHTIDHVPDPLSFTKLAYKLLRPGGILLLVMHDTQGLSVKLFGQRSPIFDIEHIYLFNKSTISNLVSRAGFVQPMVGDLANTYPLSYWVRMSGIPRWIKNMSQQIFRTLHIANTLITLKGGNIYCYAYKQA